MQKELTLSTSHHKILLTISYLNKLSYYPLSEGVYRILIGDVSDDIIPFKDCPTYGTLISFNSKKVSRYIMMLHRYGYISKKYDPQTNELYLEVTQKGEVASNKYFAKFKGSLLKKTPKGKPVIVKID
ncbi:MAG: hypothetical protein E7178_06070 [Erysipelotrichaceae bacterium]|nr:hypothetical protein [Erysipelotrichaceae bacterium]